MKGIREIFVLFLKHVCKSDVIFKIKSEKDNHDGKDLYPNQDSGSM